MATSSPPARRKQPGRRGWGGARDLPRWHPRPMTPDEPQTPDAPDTPDRPEPPTDRPRADAGQAGGPPTRGSHDAGTPSPRTLRRGRASMRPEAEEKLGGRRRTEGEKLLGSGRGRAPFLDTDTWRVLRILSEFVEGFEALAGVERGVAVFGSARTPVDSEAYETARRVGEELAKAGFAVITGGGPGAMEAVNRGAHEAGG